MSSFDLGNLKLSSKAVSDFSSGYQYRPWLFPVVYFVLIFIGVFVCLTNPVGQGAVKFWLFAALAAVGVFFFSLIYSSVKFSNRVHGKTKDLKAYGYQPPRQGPHSLYLALVGLGVVLCAYLSVI